MPSIYLIRNLQGIRESSRVGIAIGCLGLKDRF